MLSGVHKSLEFKSQFTVIETVSSIRMQTVALGDQLQLPILKGEETLQEKSMFGYNTQYNVTTEAFNCPCSKDGYD